MVRIKLKYGLPFCDFRLVYRGKEIILEDVLLDTGSGGTVFKLDRVEAVGITIENDDTIETISGVGGSEFVFKKDVDLIGIGDLEVKRFRVEIGVMEYGFDINGIVGVDFLKAVGAVIDLNNMTIAGNA